MRAKKHLGQHFLRDQAIISDIIAAILEHCDSDMPLVEVGPGEGVLTHALDEHYKNFKAIEYDRDMVQLLSRTIDSEKVIQDNFLFVDLGGLFSGQAFNLVGNFPYNISSQIIFKMLDDISLVPTMVGMFQKEVADRICAKPGTKSNGIITLLTQAYYDAESLFDIGPQAFSPPPKVMSSVIKLTRKQNTDLPCDPKIYKKIIKAAFGQRRKKMRNTLKPFLQDTEDLIFQKRPEQLSVQDFVNIAQLIESQNK